MGTDGEAQIQLAMACVIAMTAETRTNAVQQTPTMRREGRSGAEASPRFEPKTETAAVVSVALCERFLKTRVQARASSAWPRALGIGSCWPRVRRLRTPTERTPVASRDASFRGTDLTSRLF